MKIKISMATIVAVMFGISFTLSVQAENVSPSGGFIVKGERIGKGRSTYFPVIINEHIMYDIRIPEFDLKGIGFDEAGQIMWDNPMTWEGNAVVEIIKDEYTSKGDNIKREVEFETKLIEFPAKISIMMKKLNIHFIDDPILRQKWVGRDPEGFSWKNTVDISLNKLLFGPDSIGCQVEYNVDSKSFNISGECEFQDSQESMDWEYNIKVNGGIQIKSDEPRFTVDECQTRRGDMNNISSSCSEIADYFSKHGSIDNIDIDKKNELIRKLLLDMGYSEGASSVLADHFNWQSFGYIETLESLCVGFDWYDNRAMLFLNEVERMEYIKMLELTHSGLDHLLFPEYIDPLTRIKVMSPEKVEEYILQGMKALEIKPFVINAEKLLKFIDNKTYVGQGCINSELWPNEKYYNKHHPSQINVVTSPLRYTINLFNLTPQTVGNEVRFDEQSGAVVGFIGDATVNITEPIASMYWNEHISKAPGSRSWKYSLPVSNCKISFTKMPGAKMDMYKISQTKVWDYDNTATPQNKGEYLFTIMLFNENKGVMGMPFVFNCQVTYSGGTTGDITTAYPVVSDILASYNVEKKEYLIKEADLLVLQASFPEKVTRNDLNEIHKCNGKISLVEKYDWDKKSVGERLDILKKDYSFMNEALLTDMAGMKALSLQKYLKSKLSEYKPLVEAFQDKQDKLIEAAKKVNKAYTKREFENAWERQEYMEEKWEALKNGISF